MKRESCFNSRFDICVNHDQILDGRLRLLHLTTSRHYFLYVLVKNPLDY